MGENKSKKSILVLLILIAFILLNSATHGGLYQTLQSLQATQESHNVSHANWYDTLPPYNGNPYTEVNHNVPFFTKEDYARKDVFEEYSPLDSLGRCGVAYASICDELLPTEERGDISKVKPSGWKQNKIHGKFVWQRCHLIGYQLAGENDNEKNLVTGTAFFNVSGMLPFENTVRDYVNTHPFKKVLYRVTPVFEDNELVCRGVLMEAASMSDHGYEVSFNVFVWNVSDDFAINYKTGETKAY